MKIFFEYMYYRTTKISTTGSVSLTICQLLLLLNIYFFLIMGPLGIRRKLFTIEYIIVFALFIGIDYFNAKFYKGKFVEFEKRWGNETKKQKVFGMIKIISFIIFCWFLVFINAWIYNRYK